MTTRRRVQLVIDRGEGMWPFRRDVDDLIARTVDLIGVVGCFEFIGSPMSTIDGKPHQPPAAGTPVVLVTDFGIAPAEDQVPPSVWIQFRQSVALTDCPAIALCPYPIDRVPRRLQRAFEVVQWDRSTNARSARKQRR
jgi:hypothetical protein